MTASVRSSDEKKGPPFADGGSLYELKQTKTKTTHMETISARFREPLRESFSLLLIVFERKDPFVSRYRKFSGEQDKRHVRKRVANRFGSGKMGVSLSGV